MDGKMPQEAISTDTSTSLLNGKDAPKRSHTTLSLFHAWRWEGLFCVLAVASLLIVVGLLDAFNHKQIQNLPFKITLTTALSVIAGLINWFIAVPLAAGLGQLMWLRFHSGHQPLHDITLFGGATKDILGGLNFLFHRRMG